MQSVQFLNKMKYPRISIVTVSLNQGNYIEDAIQSVLKQNYKNFEHIIIDGISTDNTIEILKKYKHLKWISEKDEGQSDALNKGFKRCTGDIIGWLNSDDYYLEDTFNVVKNKLLNPSMDAVYGNCIFVNKENEDLFKKKFYQADTSATRKHGGTGLGLSICSGICNGLGGKMSLISSVQNHETIFFISLPL